MKPKAGSMRKINNIDKSLSKWIRKREKLEINNINYERGNITTDSINTKRIIGECYPFNFFPINLVTLWNEKILGETQR